jgi:hypothetical protein
MNTSLRHAFAVIAVVLVAAACGNTPASSSTSPSTAPSVAASVAPSVAPSASASASQAAAAGDINGEAAQAVKTAFAAMGTTGVSAILPFTCAAKQAQVQEAFVGGAAASLSQFGVKPADLIAAIRITFTNLVIKSVTQTGDTATVAYSADMKIDVDETKMRAIMKTVLTAQGQPADDTVLNAIMPTMLAQMNKTNHVDSSGQVVKENGKWLLCG